ncbi:MAG: baseplate J/gp47 family protein [Lachnospiraceae bacterium]|jgi:hypothetical protein|nr:baseplate J/gp47 family protein [Lachnospiraceae bacterium]
MEDQIMIKKKICTLAQSILPEWGGVRADGTSDTGRAGEIEEAEEGTIDFGMGLVEVFSLLYGDTLRLAEQIPTKNRIHLLNLLGAEALPADFAQGYAAFLISESAVCGAVVPEGFVVSGAGQLFHTTAPVSVTPARITKLFQVSGMLDTIIDCTQTLQDGSGFVPFSAKGENLQEHSMSLYHESHFRLPTGGSVELYFTDNDQEYVTGSRMEALLSEELLMVSFSDHRTVKRSLTADGALCLTNVETPMEEEIPPEVSLKLCARKIEAFADFAFDAVYMVSKAQQIRPQVIYGEGVECDPYSYRPFGDRIVRYAEVLFGSSEVLSQRGAKITLSFSLGFEKIPLSTNTQQEPAWKLVMTKSQLEGEPLYDVSISKVLWEYYNGKGFVRLFAGDEYARIFAYQEGAIRRCRMEFRCPQEIQPFLGMPRESYFIRAKIIEINHEWKWNGYACIPILSDTFLSYEYEKVRESHNLPSQMILCNQVSRKMLSRKTLLEGKKIHPFTTTNDLQEAIYLGFAQNPFGERASGMVANKELLDTSLFFVAKEKKGKSKGILKWEGHGKNGFEELRVFDETQQLHQTGIVRIRKPHSMKKQSIFGQDLYWLRITNVTGTNSFPQIETILPNVVGVRAVLGGEAGNLAAHSLTEMERSIGYIRSVTNPLPFYGGKDTESEERTIRRFGRSLKLRERAFTARDYEELLLCNFPELVACRATTGQKGTVLLTIVGKDDAKQQAYVAPSTPFDQLEAKIRQFLIPRIPSILQGNGRLLIKEAYPIYVSVFAEVLLDQNADPYQVRTKMEQILSQSLGVGQGIGVLPGKMMLTNRLGQILGILALPQMLLRYEKRVGYGEKRYFVETEVLLATPFFWVREGEHEITFTSIQ